MPLDFINSPEAKRTAAKVALTCVAAKLGQFFACSRAFDAVRNYILKGDGECARLFFNQNFATQTQAGPFQHLVILSCDAQKHTAYAIVMFFGTMTYLVHQPTKALTLARTMPWTLGSVKRPPFLLATWKMSA